MGLSYGFDGLQWSMVLLFGLYVGALVADVTLAAPLSGISDRRSDQPFRVCSMLNFALRHLSLPPTV
jgi:hypothetical protein